MKINKKTYVKNIIKRLSLIYPNAKITLKFSSPFELVIATILAAQCTDKRVNIVTEKLFKKYKTPKDYIKTPLQEIEHDIKSTGFFRNKAKHIKELAIKIVNDYEDKVPDSIKELTQLPGVGRKTANVVISNCFYRNEGVIVDTHMIRIAQLLGLTYEKDAVKIEKELNELMEPKDYLYFSNLIIALGRNICIARRPKCEICPLNNICPSSRI